MNKYLIDYYVACHASKISIGKAKKLLEKNHKYSYSEIDECAKIAAEILLEKHSHKSFKAKTKEVDIETILESRKVQKASQLKVNLSKSNFEAIFWLSAIVIIVVILILTVLLANRSLS